MDKLQADVSMQPELSGVHVSLTWLPDETLFSLISRHHFLSGSLHPWVTCWQFFGDRRRGSAHDFPCRLDELARRTGGCLGSSEAIAMERTLLPFFLPWRPQAAAHAAVRVLQGDRLGSLKFSLGLLTSRFGAQHPLKACPTCIAEDQQRYGQSYWRRCQQWPGVWICPTHGTELQVSGSKVDGQYRYAWVLPSQTGLAPAHSRWRGAGEVNSDDVLSRRLARLSRLAASAASMPSGALSDNAALSRTYRRQMVALAWLKHPDRLRWKALESALHDHLTTLAALPEFARLAMGAQPLRSHLGLLLYAPSAFTHPLRHLMLIEALFASWEDFLACHFNESEDQRAVPADCPTRSTRSAPVVCPLMPCPAAWQSARELARQYDVDTTTAMAWRAAYGLSPIRRPKILKAPVLQRLVADLRAGVSKDVAAVTAGVSVTSVTRILRTEPGLQLAWHQSRWLQRQQRNRYVWSGLLQTYPGMCTKLLRLESPGVFMWLYRNDRAWLDAQHRARAGQPSAGNHVLAKWRGRDEHLVRQVQAAAVWLAENDRLDLAGLRSVIPELGNCLKRLECLPLTQRVLLAILR